MQDNPDSWTEAAKAAKPLLFFSSWSGGTFSLQTQFFALIRLTISHRIKRLDSIAIRAFLLNRELHAICRSVAACRSLEKNAALSHHHDLSHVRATCYYYSSYASALCLCIYEQKALRHSNHCWAHHQNCKVHVFYPGRPLSCCFPTNISTCVRYNLCIPCTFPIGGFLLLTYLTPRFFCRFTTLDAKRKEVRGCQRITPVRRYPAALRQQHSAP